MEKYLFIQRIILKCKHFQIKSEGEYPRQMKDCQNKFDDEENN